MFRLKSLKFINHPFLGDITSGMEFVPDNELKETKFPYTTILIGPNGCGKSTLLAMVVEIFEDLKAYKEGTNSNTRIPYKYEIEYQVDVNLYQISFNHKINIKTKNPREERYNITRNSKEIISIKDIELPQKIIAISYLAMDRFRFKKNQTDDFYLYLGLRDQSNSARANSFLNNTLPMLFDYVQKVESAKFLKEILAFLGLNPDFLGISYIYRYKEHFFNGNLSEERFIKLFEDYTLYSNRKDTPFGVLYFQTSIRNNPELIKKIVRYINTRALQDSISVGKVSFLDFNLFDNIEFLDEIKLLTILRRLDLISSASLRFRKGVQQPFGAAQLSSGEFHFLTTLIAIQSSIENNALILIDEPETSFHPNFLMKYIGFLKNIFSNWNSSHFLIATHSHFLVSDLKGDTSEVIGLKGVVPNITAEPIIKNTYGWSAEEVLYKVFNLRSTRNYFFEISLRELLSHLSHKSKDKERIVQLFNELNKTELDRNDPLSQILIEANEYVRNL